MLKRDLNGKCLHWMRNKRRTIAVTAAAKWNKTTTAEKNGSSPNTERAACKKVREQ